MYGVTPEYKVTAIGYFLTNLTLTNQNSSWLDKFNGVIKYKNGTNFEILYSWGLEWILHCIPQVTLLSGIVIDSLCVCCMCLCVCAHTCVCVCVCVCAYVLSLISKCFLCRIMVYSDKLKYAASMQHFVPVLLVMMSHKFCKCLFLTKMPPPDKLSKILSL